MEKNVNGIDAFVRVIFGLIFVDLFFVLDGSIKSISLVGIVLLFTASVKFCPIYRIFGISTCKVRK